MVDYTIKGHGKTPAAATRNAESQMPYKPLDKRMDMYTSVDFGSATRLSNGEWEVPIAYSLKEAPQAQPARPQPQPQRRGTGVGESYSAKLAKNLPR